MAGAKRKFGDAKGQTIWESRQVKRREISQTQPSERAVHKPDGEGDHEDFDEDDNFGGFSENEDNDSDSDTGFEPSNLCPKLAPAVNATKIANTALKKQTKSESIKPKGIGPGLRIVYSCANCGSR